MHLTISTPTRFLACSLLALALTACERADADRPVNAVPVRAEGESIDWQSFHLNDKRVELVDERRREDYDLTHDGLAPAEIGTRSVAAAPVYYWRIEKHILQLSEQAGGPPFVGYEPLSMKGDILYARRTSGEIVRFKLSPFKAAAPAP